MPSVFSSGGLCVDFVFPYIISGMPDKDFKMCSATWAGVQLPGNGTVLNTSGSNEETNCSSEVAVLSSSVMSALFTINAFTVPLYEYGWCRQKEFHQAIFQRQIQEPLKDQ